MVKKNFFSNIEWKGLFLFILFGFLGEIILISLSNFVNFVWFFRPALLLFLMYFLFQKSKSLKVIHTSIFALVVYLSTFLIRLLVSHLGTSFGFYNISLGHFIVLFAVASLAGWIFIKIPEKKLRFSFPVAIGLIVFFSLIAYITEWSMGFLPYQPIMLFLSLFKAFTSPLSSFLEIIFEIVWSIVPMGYLVYNFFIFYIPWDIIYYTIIISLLTFLRIKIKKDKKQRNRNIGFLILVIAFHLAFFVFVFLVYLLFRGFAWLI